MHKNKCYIHLFLLITLVVGSWYLLNKHPKNILLSNAYKLRMQTTAYLDTLKKPITITLVTAPELFRSSPKSMAAHTQLIHFIEALRRHIDQTALQTKIQINYLHTLKDLAAIQALTHNNAPEGETFLLVQCDKQARVLSFDALFSDTQKDHLEFNGESALLSAIESLLVGTASNIYFLQGHGEASFSSTHPHLGISSALSNLAQSGYTVNPLPLSSTLKIPENANLIILQGPQVELLPEEEVLLQEYLTRTNGALMVLLHPQSPPLLLNKLFDAWGLSISKDPVVEWDKNHLGLHNNLIIRSFADHPITRTLLDNNLTVSLKTPKAIFQKLTQMGDEPRVYTPILASSNHSFLAKQEQDFQTPATSQGSYALGALVQQAHTAGHDLDIQMGKLIVIGNSEFINNENINILGNLQLFRNLVEWSIRNTQNLPSVSSSVNMHQLSISKDDLVEFAYILASLPVILMLLGVIVYFLRRH